MSSDAAASTSSPPARKKKPLWKQLYLWVLVGIAAGIVFGIVSPGLAAESRWMALVFIDLVKMIIAPTIFATVVVGIAGLGNLAKAGGLALRTVIYFNITTVFALGLGLITINLFKPGATMGLDLATFDGAGADETIASAQAATGEGVQGFMGSIVPDSFIGAFTSEGTLLQVLLLAILTAVAITMLGKRGQKLVHGLDSIAKVMFGIIKQVMWIAPIGAFGGIASAVGAQGAQVLGNLGLFMLVFWLTCLIFIFFVLGPISAWAGFNIFRYIRLIKDELLIVLGTSSSETVLPRMLAKLEAAGVPKHVVGLTIPTGYSFNLDGTAIYMTMGAIFIAQSFGIDVPIATQIGLLAFMLISSNGAAGVSGAGLVTLAASIAAFDHIIPMVGLALIVGIDRFMSEGRALTNLTGNGIGTLVIARWTGALDRNKLDFALRNPQSIDVDAMLQRDLAGEPMEDPDDDSPLRRSSSTQDLRTNAAIGSYTSEYETGRATATLQAEAPRERGAEAPPERGPEPPKG